MFLILLNIQILWLFYYLGFYLAAAFTFLLLIILFYYDYLYSG